MFQQMADGHVATPQAAFERAVTELQGLSTDLRECAIFAPGGELIAASTDAEWEARSRELWAAAATAAGEDPLQFHVATDAGEVFAVRTPGGPSVLAVTARFALESLMFCDLRAALRGLAVDATAAAA